MSVFRHRQSIARFDLPEGGRRNRSFHSRIHNCFLLYPGQTPCTDNGLGAFVGNRACALKRHLAEICSEIISLLSKLLRPGECVCTLRVCDLNRAEIGIFSHHK